MEALSGREAEKGCGNYVLFYRPKADGGIDRIRVRSGYLDIQPEEMD